MQDTSRPIPQDQFDFESDITDASQALSEQGSAAFNRTDPPRGADGKQPEKSSAPQFVPPPDDRWLTDSEVAARFGVARGTIWRWENSHPEFPSPVRLSPGTTRWKLSAIVRFENEREQGDAP